MSDDELFRWVLAAGFVAIFPVTAYYRIRSQATREPLDRRQEGWFILIALRLAGVACMAGLLAFLIDPRWMAWASLPLSRPLRWSGVVPAVAGALLTAWTLRTLGPNLTDTVVTRRDHRLVTRGPYRWVRHPFYLGAGLAFLGNGVVAANAFILATGAAAMALLALRTPIEEAKLVERFGDEYRDYGARTPRYLPRRLRPNPRPTPPRGGDRGADP